MDRRERVDAPEEAVIAAMRAWQSEMWTALPGIVQDFDPVKKTCTVVAAVRMRFKSPIDGSFSWKQIPPLLDCPVVFPSGGGCTLTFPVRKGDECLVVFASRCVDGWWKDGGIQNQPIVRMHDLSDGFVFVGISSNAKVQKGISTTETQLRSDDAGVVIGINPGDRTVNIKATKLTITADVEITGEVHNNGVRIDSKHTHSGVQSGGSSTSTPNRN